MSARVLPPLTVNSKSERKVNSLPPLGFELVIFEMLAHLSNHSAKSHPHYIVTYVLKMAALAVNLKGCIRCAINNVLGGC
jgi:hypothetical protein